MRWRVVCLTAVVALAACAPRPPAPEPAPSTAAHRPAAVHPANIKRLRSAFPPGYEVADLGGPVSVAGSWGFGPGWTADPAECGALADPGTGGSRGLSASGQGGTIYAVVAEAGPAGAALTDQCARWTLTATHTGGSVELAAGPPVEGADTVSMTVATRTVVESGTETDGRAATALAFLGDHVAFVTLVTDPGSVHPPLDPGVVSELIAKTVAALRG